MKPIPATRTLARPDLDGCPVGFLFRGKEPDRSKEEACFAGMEAPLNHRSWRSETYLYLIEDEEGKALEHIAKSEATLVTEDPYLSDYRVEASIRQFIPGAWPNMDDEYCRVARNGLIFRMQDLRRYYQFCLEGYDRVVLYRRRDYDRIVLAEERFPIDPTSYHHLIAEAQGDRLRCWCDGRPIANVTDDVYAEGVAGIRMNSICRFREISVSTWEEGYRVYVSRTNAATRELMEVRERVPKPEVWRTYEMSRLRPGAAHFFRPEPDGPVRMLIASSGGEEFRGLSMFDLEGNLLWSAPASQGPGEMKFADVDGDGVKEIVSFWDDGLAIHRSTDGECLAEGERPDPGPFDRNQERASINHLYPADLHGRGRYDSVVLKDDSSAGGWTFRVYDADLRLQWSQTVQLPPMGHNITLHDVNQDGREEILAGYHCYTGDGDLLWRVEAARYWDVVHGARHPDSVIAGELWPGKMRAAYAGGGEGFVLVDATCGDVLAHDRIGHAQGVIVAKFDRDVPGHQILIGTRHENYGILCFFDGDGQPIGRFQPDYFSQGGPSVNWTGDGAEFVLLTSSLDAYGLWDCRGHYVLDLKELDLFGDAPMERRMGAVGRPVDIVGDPRDELAIQYGGQLFLLTQDRPVEGDRIYAPIRNERVMYPSMSFERWVSV